MKHKLIFKVNIMGYDIYLLFLTYFMALIKKLVFILFYFKCCLVKIKLYYVNTDRYKV